MVVIGINSRLVINRSIGINYCIVSNRCIGFIDSNGIHAFVVSLDALLDLGMA